MTCLSDLFLACSARAYLSGQTLLCNLVSGLCKEDESPIRAYFLHPYSHVGTTLRSFLMTFRYALRDEESLLCDLCSSMDLTSG